MNTKPATAIKRAISAIDPEHDRNQHRRIQAATVRELCGGVSDMTLWRWLENGDLNFPRPIYIGRRRYWRETDVSAWLDAQTEVAA